MKIISVTPSAKPRPAAPKIRITADTPPLPEPPMGGFSPLVAIVTSDRHSSDDFDWEQVLVSSYVGKPLNAPAEKNFVVGVLDTGSVADLAAGDSATLLGLKGSYLTTNTCPIGGVGGTMDATITTPVGFFAAGLGAIKADGQLDLSKLVGHTNVAGLASPAHRLRSQRERLGGRGDPSAGLLYHGHQRGPAPPGRSAWPDLPRPGHSNPRARTPPRPPCTATRSRSSSAAWSP